MNEQGRNEQGRSEHAHLAEPEIVEAALEGGANARIAACAECSARLERASAWLASVRGSLAAADAEPDPAVARLAERVLAVTTREELGLRGDLRLAWSFARSRIRSSPALRVAAALLVVQLAAVPVLAWMVLRAPAPEPHFHATIELPRDPIYREPETEPERRLAVDEPGEPRFREGDPSRDEAAAYRRAEAEALRALGAPDVGAAEPSDALARLLWARARQIETGELPEGARAELLAAPAAGAGAAELALRLDLALDRWSLTGARPEATRRIALALVAASPGPGDELSTRALRRAELHGLLAPASAAVPARDGAIPLDSGWSKALEGIAGDSAERTRVIRAWRGAVERAR